MADFRLQIVTQQKTVFDRNVTALTMPGEDGFFGVLANHAPIISVLAAGPMDIRVGSEVTRVKIGGGFFEMEGNKATLLADGLEGLKVQNEDS